MAESNFTLTRISIESRDKLKVRAIKNHRSMPGELDFLLETVEAMEKTGIKQVQVMPGPKGSARIPVVTMESQEPA